MNGPPSTPLVIVKLGGSVLTRKREVERIRPKILERLARELAQASGSRIVVLHGAGSFGHPGARRWGHASPPTADPGRHRTRGAAIVQSEVRRLHGKVLSSLIDAGAVPFSIPPSTHARNRSGRLETLDAGPFERALDAGGWPVSFGDVVPDAEWGFSILSADAIATELARRLRPARVVFVSDVPGILEPGTAGRRKVVEAVTPEIVAQLGRTSAGPDVTGGIRGKAEAMLAIAADGADAVLISGLTDGALLRAVRGEAVYGSWSRASPRDR